MGRSGRIGGGVGNGGDRAGRSGGGGASDYEDLTGGQGREVFFRPDRYNADELSLVRPVVHVIVEGHDAVACALRDVSQNGVAFDWESDSVPPDLGSVLSGLRVTFDGCAAYDGTARVTGVRARADGQEGWTVAATFLDTLMDVDDVLRLRDVHTWANAGPHPRFQTDKKAWHVEGHEEFKSTVSDFRLFLEDAEREFESLEDAFPPHLLYRESESPAQQGLLDIIDRQFVPPFLDFSSRLDAALRSVDDTAWEALREFSNRHVHALMIRSRSLKRALDKPLGYPGDFLVLESIYDWGFEGSTLFDRAVERAVLSLPAAAAVRARRDLLRTRLDSVLTRPPSSPRGRALRIVSVASGPAREFAEVLRRIEDCPTPVDIVLFDQDKQALAHAYRSVSRIATERFSGQVRVTLLYDSIKRLLHDPEIFSSFGPFDVLFCSGLFDYLPKRSAVSLARKLHANLVEGGEAWIGNMHPSNPTRWAMEHIMEWNLLYRTTSELRELGEEATDGGSVSIVKDETHINPFAVLTRD